jgi:hypothetical protein
MTRQGVAIPTRTEVTRTAKFAPKTTSGPAVEAAGPDDMEALEAQPVVVGVAAVLLAVAVAGGA